MTRYDITSFSAHVSRAPVERLTWQWCGRAAGDVPLPSAIHARRTPPRYASKPNNSTVAPCLMI